MVVLKSYLSSWWAFACGLRFIPSYFSGYFLDGCTSYLQIGLSKVGGLEVNPSGSSPHRPRLALEWITRVQALQVLRDDLRRHDDSGALVGTYAHGRLADGAMYLSQGPLHALPVA